MPKKKKSVPNLYVEKAVYVAGGGTLLMIISSFMNWLSILGGGISGLNGDGKYFLLASLISGGVLLYAHIKRQWRFWLLAVVQAWGVFAIVWMATLIWKVSTIFDASDLKDNPFATLFSSQVGAGPGLYFGLLGAVVLSASLAFITLHKFKDKIKFFAIIQASIFIIAALIFTQSSAGNLRPVKDTHQESSILPSLPSFAKKSDLEEDFVLEPVMKNKRFDKGRYDENVWFDIDWKVKKAKKPAKAIKGVLHATDLFDEEKFRLNYTLNEPLEEGKAFTEKGTGFEYNKFKDSHNWMKTVEVENLKLKFTPLAVVYSDGSVEGAGEDYPKNSYLVPTLKNKRFDRQGYEDFIWFDISWDTTKLPKSTRAVKGVLHIVDVFGEPKLSINTTIDTPLEPGKPYTEKGTGFEYNQFKQEHDWVLGTKEKDMNIVFVPTAIIYTDGTKEEF